jgi:hypothetical protein
VQVFQSDGTFVGKFGTMGNRPGQLEHPHYIAVSSTNRVIVLVIFKFLFLSGFIENVFHQISPSTLIDIQQIGLEQSPNSSL